MIQFLKKIFGDKKSKDVKELEPLVVEINAHYETIEQLSDDELRAKTQEFKNIISERTADLRGQIEEMHSRLRSNEEFDREDAHNQLDELNKQLDELYEDVLDELLPEAFAVVKATCKKLVGTSWDVMGHKLGWEMVPYDVQLMGGIVLHQGKIAEMATGEGKTLVATLPLYLNALTGRGVHLVTVNDYLAQRDSQWMGKIFEFHGLTVGCITSNMPPDKRKAQYHCDIIYGTNNEFGFDYLRDNMAIDSEYLVQRIHNYAIVDEVDSVLIDEARTPLIISGQVDVDDHKFNEFKPGVEKLVRLQSNLVAKLVKDAEELLAKEDKDSEYEAGKLLLRAYRGLPKNRQLVRLLSEPRYKKLQQETELEFLREKSKNMYIIDDELYFVIDEKNHSIDLMEKGREELSKATREGKEFFVMTDLGTEFAKFENDPSLSEEEKAKRKEVLYAEYGQRSDSIHTVHQLLRAYTLYDRDDEYVITEEGKIAIVDEFTGRVLPGRRYSDGLHQAIEAKENVHVEKDTQTLATITLQNYFRMYKKLAGMTGTAETEEGEFFEIYKLEVVVIPTNQRVTREDLDDAIYKTKREKYNAIVDTVEELRKEGRPVLVGTTSVEVSETLSRMLKRKNLPHNVLNAKQHQREAEIVTSAGQVGAVTIATNMAGRGTDIKLGAGVKERGGLYILGTERHESRRIDRQLRGRSGRQGDPGTSKFYLSLEDDLMRLFGSDKMATVMERMKMDEGEVIQHPWITKSVERAQKRVEENNFAIRKRLLEYDNVMNQQRSIVYQRRKRALEGERLKDQVFEMLDEYIDELVNKHADNGDLELIRQEFVQNMLIDVKITAEDFQKLGKAGYTDALSKAALDFYTRKEESLGADNMARIERYAFLTVTDTRWKEHLRDMDDLKEGIGLRAYAQKDPLVEYKNEAFEMFILLNTKIRNEMVSFCFKFFPQMPSEVEERERARRTSQARKQLLESKSAFEAEHGLGSAAAMRSNQPVRAEERIGRNDPCPCGSGKKYKNCHGK